MDTLKAAAIKELSDNSGDIGVEVYSDIESDFACDFEDDKKCHNDFPTTLYPPVRDPPVREIWLGSLHRRYICRRVGCPHVGGLRGFSVEEIEQFVEIVAVKEEFGMRL